MQSARITRMLRSETNRKISGRRLTAFVIKLEVFAMLPDYQYHPTVQYFDEFRINELVDIQ